MGHLLQQPHHDGSPRYIGDDAPTLGSTVTVFCRTSTAMPVRSVWVRSTPDAEPHFDEAVVDRRTEHTVWWRADVHVRNPVQRYRFMVALDDGYLWLNGAGVFAHDVPDAQDFVLSSYPAAPDWGRDAVVYQIFPDRFGRSAAADRRQVPGWAKPARWDDPVVFEGADTPLQYYGGDLDGITEHLDHIAAVGANVVYTTPLFPAESNHRYNAATFDHIDPLLGGDEALHRLVTAVHERGWRMLGDLTTNHTGNTHEWFRRAVADPSSAERSYYYFDEHGGYEGWMAHPTLPKLDHTNDVMRHRLVDGPDSVVARWLSPPHDLDGWRIDVANMTGRHAGIDVAHEVARRVRETSVGIREDALVLAEHGHDASGDLDGDGWHGTMNYVGFSYPVWSWLRDPSGPVPTFGLPVPLPRRTGPQAVATMRAFLGGFGWRAFGTSWNILSSHDSPRIRTITGASAPHRVAAGLQFSLPGVPMVFAGDEIGLEGTIGEDSRRTMPWDRQGSWDHATMSTYSSLAALRRSHAALRRGGLRWVHISDDALVYVREHDEGSVLVAASRGRASRGGAASVSVPVGALELTDGTALFGTSSAAAGAAPALRVTGRGPDAMVEIPLGAEDGADTGSASGEDSAAFAVYAL